MSTATALTPTAPSKALRNPALTGRQTLGRAIAAEWIKIRSLRSTWITSAITIVITVLFSAGVIIAMSQSPAEAESAAGSINMFTTFGQIAVAVLAALSITGEYSSGQIRSSLAAVPRRRRLLAAKAVVVGALAFMLGLGSIALSWAISAPFMKGHEGSLTDAKYLGLFWGTGLAFALIALMSLGLGLLMRSTAGAITMVTILLFVVHIPLSLMAIKWEWAAKASHLVPSAAAKAVLNPLQYGGWADASFSHPTTLVVFLAWTLIPLALGWLVFIRRDA